LTKTAHNKEDRRRFDIYSSSFFSFEKPTINDPTINKMPMIVGVTFVLMKLKFWLFPKNPSLNTAKILVLNDKPSKFEKITIRPSIVAGIRINQPAFLYLLGSNNLFDIKEFFIKVMYLLQNDKYILHLDKYLRHSLILQSTTGFAIVRLRVKGSTSIILFNFGI
jgi:hypothetical protein